MYDIFLIPYSPLVSIKSTQNRYQLLQPTHTHTQTDSGGTGATRERGFRGAPDDIAVARGRDEDRHSEDRGEEPEPEPDPFIAGMRLVLTSHNFLYTLTAGTPLYVQCAATSCCNHV